MNGESPVVGTGVRRNVRSFDTCARRGAVTYHRPETQTTDVSEDTRHPPSVSLEREPRPPFRSLEPLVPRVGRRPSVRLVRNQRKLCLRRRVGVDFVSSKGVLMPSGWTVGSQQMGTLLLESWSHDLPGCLLWVRFGDRLSTPLSRH